MVKQESNAACAKPQSLISAGLAIRFFCLFVIIYGLLMVAWPVTRGVYSKIYRSTGEFLFSSFGREGVVYFSQPEESRDFVKINIISFSQNSPNESGNISGTQLLHNIRYGDYMNTAFLAALTLATPLPLKRRGGAIVWGLLVMHVFVVFKIAIMLLTLFSSEPFYLSILSPFWKKVIIASFVIFADHMNTGFLSGFVIAFFIWILVTFRRGDWSKIVSGRWQESGVTHKVLKRRTIAIGVGA